MSRPDDVKLCPCCGSKLVEYKHTLSAGLVRSLRRLAETGGGEAHLEAVGLNYSERCNFQKLRYWALVERVPHPSGAETGVWRVTDDGWAFLSGERAARRCVWTFRGDPVRESAERVWIDEPVAAAWRRRRDYAADASPRGGAEPEQLW